MYKSSCFVRQVSQLFHQDAQLMFCKYLVPIPTQIFLFLRNMVVCMCVDINIYTHVQRKRQCTHRSILREIKWGIFCRSKIKGPQLFGFGIPMLRFEIWKTCHQENKLKGYTSTSSTEPPAHSLQKTRDCLQSDIFAGTQTKYLGSGVPVVLLCLPVKLMLMNSSKEFTTFSLFQYSQNRFPQLFSPKSKKAETPLLSWPILLSYKNCEFFAKDNQVLDKSYSRITQLLRVIDCGQLVFQEYIFPSKNLLMAIAHLYYSLSEVLPARGLGRKIL